MSEPLRVTFLCVMPSPYTQDLMEAIHADGRIRPAVYYMELAQPDTHWRDVQLPDYARLLPGRAFNLAGGRLQWNRQVLASLRQDDPQLIVVNSYSGITTQLAMAALSFRRAAWVFWGEVPGLNHRGLVGRAARRLAQYPVGHWAQGIAAVGTRAVRAYSELTSSRCPVVNIPYHCELGPLLAIERPRPQLNEVIRFLYCGQMIARKGVDVLLESFIALAREFPQVHLTLTGDGPLRAPLCEQVPPDVRERIEWTGFKQPSELPEVFAQHDVFLLPSRHDGWGVVVNQALAAGMPVVVSDAVGAGDDLVFPQQNGLVVRPGSAAELTQAMRFFALHPEQIQSFGRASRSIALDWTPQRGVDRWCELCDRVLAARSQTGAHTQLAS